MKSGKAYYQVVKEEHQGKSVENMRAVIPIIASKNYLGKDCLMCHIVPEGTVLGAVSMKISLDRANKAVRDFTWKIFAVAVVFSIPVAAVHLPVHGARSSPDRSRK